ncbi:MAG: hypothetical protein QM733_22185 [Ilumatobacteraceae bacterium]
MTVELEHLLDHLGAERGDDLLAALTAAEDARDELDDDELVMRSPGSPRASASSAPPIPR